jgi:cell wall-associated NlpC family hydrolase
VLCALELSDTLARRGIGYHHDQARDVLRLENLEIGSLPPELSCSEFVWFVYSRCGLDLGDTHRNTRNLVYAKHNYPRGMQRVADRTIRPGDLLVYDFDLAELERRSKLVEGEKAGHVVLVVSAEQQILIGSHGMASTPEGAPEGVGYRRLRGDFSRWTAGRTLRAIYRPKASRGAGTDRADMAAESPGAAHEIQLR